jgi:hypothetical protein
LRIREQESFADRPLPIGSGLWEAPLTTRSTRIGGCKIRRRNHRPHCATIE